MRDFLKSSLLRLRWTQKQAQKPIKTWLSLFQDLFLCLRRKLRKFFYTSSGSAVGCSALHIYGAEAVVDTKNICVLV